MTLTIILIYQLSHDIYIRLRLEFPRAKLSVCKLRIFGVQGGAVLPRATLSRLKYVSGGLVTV